MKLDYQLIEDKANTLYSNEILKYRALSTRYVEPEDIPQIKNEQIKCFFRALIEEFNKQQNDN